MSMLRTALYGVLIWAVVLGVAMLAFSFRVDDRPLFESVMAVALTAAVTAASVAAFGRERRGGIGTGVRLGVTWLVVNLALDALAFSRGPMQMALADYVKDIGVTYLLIPVVPIGMGWALAGRRR